MAETRKELVLQLLSDHPDGLLSGDLKEGLGLTGTNPVAHVNMVMHSMRRHGLVSRSALKERSPRYKGAWTYRWFITSDGLSALAEMRAGTWGRTGMLIRRAERIERRAEEYALWDQLLSEARAAGFGRDTPRPERNAEIERLRQLGLPYSEIGGLFHITGERVRQIANHVAHTERRPGKQRVVTPAEPFSLRSVPWR